MLVIDYIIKVGILDNFFRYMIKLLFLPHFVFPWITPRVKMGK